MSAAATKAVLAQIFLSGNDRQVRALLSAQGATASLAYLDQLGRERRAADLLRLGATRPAVRDRLLAAGASRSSAYRAIHQALNQKDRHRGTPAADASSIPTNPED